jgi:hypothetical protein
VSQEDQEPTQGQVSAPAVPVVDAVPALQVGLDRSLVVTKEAEEARYSPADSKPYAVAKACMKDSRSRTFGLRPCSFWKSVRTWS